MKKAPRKLTLHRESLRRLEGAELYGPIGAAATALCVGTLAQNCVSHLFMTCGCATAPC
ncbi:MAG TPA: hypothetical protein VFR03_01090 [Thermoanaerobaculia bacterium]|nr:hypothetical protein [Thermoanaerobaculia bacterium]